MGLFNNNNNGPSGEAVSGPSGTEASEPSRNTTPRAEGKGYKYRCKKACTYGGVYRAEGSVIVSATELNDSLFEPVN